jgi:hypothetical protein
MSAATVTIGGRKYEKGVLTAGAAGACFALLVVGWLIYFVRSENASFEASLTADDRAYIVQMRERLKEAKQKPLPSGTLIVNRDKSIYVVYNPALSYHWVSVRTRDGDSSTGFGPATSDYRIYRILRIVQPDDPDYARFAHEFLAKP